MSSGEQKVCPRCGQLHDCRGTDVEHCHCRRVQLTPEQREWLAAHYSDCLCGNCLRTLATGAR